MRVSAIPEGDSERNLADGEPISGEDLLRKAIRARGGLTGLRELRTLTLRGTARGPGGGLTPFQEDRGASGHYRRDPRPVRTPS